MRCLSLRVWGPMNALAAVLRALTDPTIRGNMAGPGGHQAKQSKSHRETNHIISLMCAI